MIPIFKPYMPQNIISELEKVLYSGNLTFGVYGKKFEQSLIDYYDNDKVLVVGSYNYAMLIILSALGLKSGDEVIATPVSCLASNQPFAVKGLRVIWADVDPTTGAMSVEDVKNKISTNTKAIFHNHYCGYLGYINELNQLGKEYGIPVIDDCIEAFGSELGGRKVGCLGSDATIFSFQTVRLPNSIDGGAIVFNDKELCEKAKLIRDYGIERTLFRDDLNEITKNCNISLEGYGALMNEMNALIGYSQMSNIDNLISKQRHNANKWNQILNGRDDVKPLERLPNTSPNYWVYGIMAKDKISAIKMFRELGFYATGVHINNNIYSVFNNKVFLKGVSEFMASFVGLPCGWWVEGDQIKL